MVVFSYIWGMKRNGKDDIVGMMGEKYHHLIARGSMKEGSRLIDLSDEDEFRNLDCDFAIAEEGITAVDIWRNEMNGGERSGYRLEEVKADKKILGTGDVVYEVLSSSGKLGCTELTLADTIYYYALDSDWRVVKGWAIDVEKWRKWFRNAHRFLHGKEKSEKVESNRQAPNGRTIWTCSINEMIYDGVAEEIEINRNVSDLVRKMFGPVIDRYGRGEGE